VNPTYSPGTQKTRQSQDWTHTLLSWLRTNGVMIALASLVIIGSGLRLYDLGAESLWQDEVTMIQIVTDPALVAEEISLLRPPLYVLLGHVWVQIFGSSPEAVRSLSMVASILSIIVIFMVGRELVDDRVGLIAAFFATFSGRQIFHAQYFRYYAVLLLVAALSFYFLIRFARHGRWRDGIPYIIFAALTYYAQVFGIFILVAQGLFFLTQWFVYKPTRLKWVISQIAIIVAISPHLIPYGLRVAGFNPAPGNPAGFGPEWMTLPSLTEPFGDLVRFLFYGYETLFIGLALIVTLVGLGVYIVRRSPANWLADLRQGPSQGWAAIREHHSALTLVLLWLVLGMGLPFVLSFVLSPMYIDRYVFVASPALYLLLAMLIVAFRRLIPPLLVLAVFLITALPGLATTYYNQPIKEQWREAAALVSAEGQPGDVIVVPTYDRQKFSVYHTFDWYYEGDLPVCQLIHGRLAEAEIADAFRACTGEAQTIWLVLFTGNNFPTKADDMRAMYADLQPEWAMTEQAELHQVTVYRLGSDITNEDNDE